MEGPRNGRNKVSIMLESGFSSGTLEIVTREGYFSPDYVEEIKREAKEKGYDAYAREDPEEKGLYHIRLEKKK